MFTRGEYSDKTSTYGVLISHNKQETEIVLVVSGEVASAFKRSGGDDYSFLSNKAKNLYTILHAGLAGCTSKNGISVEFDLGTSVIHQFTKSKLDYAFELFNGEIVGADIQGDTDSVKLSYCKDGVNLIPQGIPYIKLTKTKAPDFSAELEDNNDDLDGVQVRTVQEIALEKEDVTWLNNKKYYIVNDDEQAEKLFNYFENYNGVIAYDTETTGLRINCFGKINSDYKRQLEEFNRNNPKEQIRADRLVGIIFCVEPDVSYYFPCFNRKFKNLYDTENETQKKVINNIKVRYTLGEFRDKKSDMADYIRNTPSDEWGCDVILMERVRNILEKHHIVAHNGAFEWKVGYQYEIDTNLKDDTLLLHQILYKFRSTTSNRGEPSNLKYLAKRELNIEQWELYDFFPDFKESIGEVRSKASGKKKKNKKGSKIDFSYMDYEGTRIYAPTDGDVTLQLFMRYKRDMMLNHKEQEYIYNVEVVVACAIAYMEFYGHRIDEDKIAAVRDQTKAKTASIESQIRQYVKYSGKEELEAYDKLQKAMEKFTEADNNGTKEEREKANEETLTAVAVLQEAIAKDEEHILNLGSPSQVSELFYNKLEIPFTGEKKSVAKKEIKSLIQAKNEDGSKKYPIVHMYSEYKKMDTLMTKFFDNLPYYMYPGGIVFSSFGQISTATGRMSCSKPNAQQYPKDVTAIVVPRPGFVMADADYSQIEYRVLVAMAGEEELAKMFSDPDSDYHTLMASMMYGVPYASVTPKMRGDAKSFNFGIPYGMGYGSLAILLTGVNNATTRAEAAEKYELYFKDQPKTRKFFDQVKEMAQVNKYTRTFWSRYRYYSFTDADGNENSGRKAAALRQAGNAIIQGCLHGDTRIQTKEMGIVKIKNAVDTHQMVWDGDKWSNGDILYSGKKQKCIVTFSNKQQIICSPIHKFLVTSAKGNKRFVECKDLLTKEISKSPHRVVINQKYEPSDYKYSSDWADGYKTSNHMSRNVQLADIGNSFKVGVVLGRLASDGSIFNRNVGGSNIRQIIAEHEYSIIPTLMEYMKNLGVTERNNELREGRNQCMTYLSVYSQALVDEISALDIKHTLHDNIFMDTELLRGFLRGMFDGDGGISGKVISLVFGKQYDFEPMCKDIQKALMFLGIRSRYYDYKDRHSIVISTYDNKRFTELVGFINSEKTEKAKELECVNDEHIFGKCLLVESVEITDEYIDMYDVCNTDGGYYVADGIITHNTAADIFKISVARNFMYIRENKLLGLLLIINMIHDEQLFELNMNELNIQRVLRDIGVNMQFKVEGFPPLYIGAGLGSAWAKAKGKMAEIHPLLLDRLSEEAKNMPIRREDNTEVLEKDVLKYFNDRVVDFRREMVREYLINPDNFGKDLHPAIGNLLNLQFSYGHDKEKEGLDDGEFTLLCVREFIEHEGLAEISAEMFVAQKEALKDIEDEDEYSDDDDDELEDDLDYGETDFALVDESSKVYGSSVQDLIKIFGCFVSKSKRICGINLNVLGYKKKESLIEFLSTHHCDVDAPGAMEIVFLQEAGILNRTGVHVSNIEGSEIERRIKEMSIE